MIGFYISSFTIKHLIYFSAALTHLLTIRRLSKEEALLTDKNYRSKMGITFLCLPCN